jgi:hypothetical protein
VDETFERKGEMSSNNLYFENERDQWNNIGMHTWPVAVINGVIYRGSLDPETLHMAVCSGFNEEKEFCKKHSRS